MTEKGYRLVLCEIYHKCTDSQGEWDGCWDSDWEWIIYNSEMIEVGGMSGYSSRHEAEQAGTKALNKLLNK